MTGMREGADTRGGGHGLSGVVDAVVAVLVMAVFWVPSLRSEDASGRALVGALLAAAVAASLLVRWRFLLLTPLVAIAATGAGWLLGASSDPMLGAAWCLYPTAVDRLRRFGVILGAGVLAVVATVVAVPGGAGSRVVGAVAALGVSVVLGSVEGRRLRAVAELSAAEAAEQRSQFQLAMSRDVHDVVGHALTVISAEADVTRNLPDATDDDLRGSLANIEQRARAALEEVQGLVRALRSSATGDVRSGIVETPSILDDLVAAARLSGLDVTASVNLPVVSPADRDGGGAGGAGGVEQRRPPRGGAALRGRAVASGRRLDGPCRRRRHGVPPWPAVRSATRGGSGGDARAGRRNRRLVDGDEPARRRCAGLGVAAAGEVCVSGPIRVLLADDDPDFRRVYRRLFERTDGFRVDGEAATGTEALHLIGALRPDVALVDVQMPGGSGLDVVRGAAESSTRIAVLTTFHLDEYVAEALRDGAAGFLLKNASSSEVLAAVRAVRAGHGALAPEVTGRLMGQFSSRPRANPHPFAGTRLSTREVQVVRLVAAGRSNQRIADELHLSLPTVRTYLQRLFRKLDVADRTELAVRAHEAGLLHDPR